MSDNRSLGRQAKDFLRYPLSAIEGKYGRRRGLSAFRIIVLTLLYNFVTHWPPFPWGVWDWATFVSLLLALPASDLVSAVPAKEALLALTAMFGGMVSKRTTVTESTYTQEDK